MSSNTVEKVGTRTRAAECKLRDVKYLEIAGLIADATEAVPNRTTGDKDDEGNALFQRVDVDLVCRQPARRIPSGYSDKPPQCAPSPPIIYQQALPWQHGANNR